MGIINKIEFSGKQKNFIIILPTQVACSKFLETYKKFSKNIKQPITLPISDLSYLFKENNHTPPADRITIINQLSKFILELKTLEYKNLIQATILAENITDLFLQISAYEIDHTKIKNFISENLAIHKQKVSFFIEKSFSYLMENFSHNQVSYNNYLINNLIDKIADKTLILAGLNSLIPAIRNMLKASLKRPNKYVIFYGIDDEIPETTWKEIDEQHHQFSFKTILEELEINRNEIQAWNPKYSSTPQEKEAYLSSFISKAFMPANHCHNWYKNQLEPHNISLYKYPDLITEAKNIVQTCKIYSDKNILIVTNDEELTKKLIYFFKINNTELCLIRDQPLAKTGIAVWLELILNFLLDKHSLISSLALFKHKYSKIEFLEIENRLREKNKYIKNIFALSEEFEEIAKLKINFQDFPFFASFSNFLRAHIDLAKELSKENLQENDAAIELFKQLELIGSSLDSSYPIDLQEYSMLFKHYLKSAYFRPKTAFSRIILCKPVDSRLLRADLVILSGLNHDVWPKYSSTDPLLSDSLNKKLGLPSAKEKLGNETFDFWCLANAKQIILTRAEKINSTKTLASPWLLRLEALSKGIINKEYHNIKIVLNNKLQRKKFNTPKPCPPIELRPQKLSATQIEKLVFNPYHIYVDLVLKLKKLPPLNKEISAIDFGNFVHKAIAIHYKSGLNFEAAGKAALDELKLDSKIISILWWNRYLRIGKWLTENDFNPEQLLIEAYGKYILANNFEINAIADRIEIFDGNKLNIIDYKTGKISSIKSIQEGKALQLLIEGLIASNGKFNLQKNGSYKVNSIKYIQLNGDEEIVKTIEINEDVEKLITKTKDYLIDLTSEYNKSSTNYHYSKKKLIGYCEYAHLARQ